MESRFDVADLFRREPLSFEANRIHSESLGIAFADRFGIRQYILCYHAVPTDVTMGADSAELMHPRKCADRRMVLNDDVPASVAAFAMIT